MAGLGFFDIIAVIRKSSKAVFCRNNEDDLHTHMHACMHGSAERRGTFARPAVNRKLVLYGSACSPRSCRTVRARTYAAFLGGRFRRRAT